MLRRLVPSSDVEVLRWAAWVLTGMSVMQVPIFVILAVASREHMKGTPFPPWIPISLGVSAVALVSMTVRLWRSYRQLADAPKVAVSARRLTQLAVLLAGPKRAVVRAEWASHLSGETGTGLPPRQQARDALGFVGSALQYRLADAADAAWTPVDAILRSRKLSNLLVLGPTTVAAICILHRLGTIGVLTSAESVSALGGSLYGLVRVGRWWRDVKLPEPKAQRAAKKL